MATYDGPRLAAVSRSQGVRRPQTDVRITNLRTRVMNRYVTVGLSVLAGVALFETALLPGVVIGGAAVLAPKYLSRLSRQLQPPARSTASRRIERRAALPARHEAPLPARRNTEPPEAEAAGFNLKQAVVKTITFRVIVTTLDFSTNYLVLGELAVAAGLSTFALVGGPLFYFLHETAWNYYHGSSETSVNLSSLPSLRGGPRTGRGGFTISRAVAKTITYRTFASVVDFTANYVVIGDLATAAGLTAFGFVVGPFVYLGHEKAWDHFSSRGARPLDPSPPTAVIVAL
jgi:uncharacterized membrane protein